MANIKTLKRRIKSARSISQITKAMEMVAASKMKRSQDQALKSRPYSNKMESVISSLVKSAGKFRHPLIKHNDSEQILVLLISTNKSLCGSLNTNLFRHLYHWSEQFDQKSLSFITMGNKGAEFVNRAGFQLIADHSDMSEKFSFEDTLDISRPIIKSFREKKYGQVYVVFSDFISTLVQKPQIRQLLPIDTKSLKIENDENIINDNNQKEIWSRKEYLIEPNAKKILSWLLPYFIELKIFHYLLEGTAAEHSARMVSMKNATDNAKEIVTDLTLSFNKARQAQITAEIAEVASASLTN